MLSYDIREIGVIRGFIVWRRGFWGLSVFYAVAA